MSHLETMTQWSTPLAHSAKFWSLGRSVVVVKPDVVMHLMTPSTDMTFGEKLLVRDKLKCLGMKIKKLG